MQIEERTYNDEEIDKLKWKIALENSNVGMWDWNVKTNHIFYSLESKKLLGYADDELDNKAVEWDKRVHPDDQELYFRDFNRHINGELDYYVNEHRVLCKDGSYKWILDRGKIVSRDGNGKPTRIIGTHADITARKNSQNLLRKNIEIITEQKQRLQNFTYVVSHNLNTHLNNFKNILEFYDESEDEQERKELVSHLHTISNALNETVGDLNNIINIKTSFNQLNETINLHDFVKRVVDGLDIETSKFRVSIYNDIPNDLNISTNKSYLESIFYNLISNAIKYSKAESDASFIKISSSITNQILNIIIEDNGIGMDMEKYGNRIFEIYTTFHGTKRNDSKGMGLYITKTQIDAIGGSIDVYSEIDKGTIFTITLPITE